MGVPAIYVDFPTRASRSEFVAAHFERYLKETVLDVGCFEAPLRSLLHSAKYRGIDVAGNPDIQVDLEKTSRLPFDDNSFATVLCIDVLEHIDNLHAIFDELARVARQHVIVSLPNCWCVARQPLGRGKGCFSHYGLPLTRPVDRHKWFFSFSEAKHFIETRAEELDLSVEQLFGAEKRRNPVLRWVRKVRYPGERYVNRYSRTVWAVLCKNEVGAPAAAPSWSRVA